jgi:hypothetical protein
LPFAFGLFFTGATIYNLIIYTKLRLNRNKERQEYEEAKNEFKIDRLFNQTPEVNQHVSSEDPVTPMSAKSEQGEEGGPAYFTKSSFVQEEPETPKVYYK